MKIPFKAALLGTGLWAALSLLPAQARAGHGPPHVVRHPGGYGERWRDLRPDQQREILRARRAFQQLPPQAQRRLWAEYRRRHQKGPPPGAPEH